MSAPFVLAEMRLCPFRNKPGQYLDLRLADRTGAITARLWEGAEEAAPALAVGQVVMVEGRVDEYRGSPQLVITALRLAEPGEYEAGDLVRESARSREEMEAELGEMVASVSTEPLRALLKAVFGDEEFRARFATAPGAARLHHAYRGGLLEHTLAVASLCREAVRLHPDLDYDLLITGALLHDVGKVFELRGEYAFDYTDEGRFCGHLVLTDRFVTARLAQVPEFPETLRQLLTHLLLSHHGELQYGAPVRPKIAEALALHYADNLDAKIQTFADYRESAESGPGPWSPYHHALEAQLYLGEGRAESERQTEGREGLNFDFD